MWGPELQRSLGNEGTKYLEQVKHETKNKRIHCKFIKEQSEPQLFAPKTMQQGKHPTWLEIHPLRLLNQRDFHFKDTRQTEVCSEMPSWRRGIKSKLHSAPFLSAPTPLPTQAARKAHHPCHLQVRTEKNQPPERKDQWTSPSHMGFLISSFFFLSHILKRMLSTFSVIFHLLWKHIKSVCSIPLICTST